MRKQMLIVVFGLALCLPFNLFAKTICFTGSASGSYFYLSGGKVDEKPFSGNWILQSSSCNMPVWAAIVTDSTGNYHIGINAIFDPVVTSCTSVWWWASGPTLQSMSGQIDGGQDGTIDASFTLTEINCNSVPSAKPIPKRGRQ